MHLEWCAKKWSLLISEDCEVEQWELDESPCLCGDEIATAVFIDTPENREAVFNELKKLLSERHKLKLEDIEKISLKDAYYAERKI